MNGEEFFAGTELGEVMQYRNLALVPVLGEDRFDVDVLPVDQAIATDDFRVIETGKVPFLDIFNSLDVPVFIPVGATFEGGTQNRAAQYPAIVATDVRIEEFPVHCVEEGQPLTDHSEFRTSSTILLASARSGERGQHRTWDTIHNTQISSGARSETRDYATINRQVDLTEYMNILREVQPDQLGYLAAVRHNGNISLYADVLGNRGLFSAFAEKLYRSVGIVAKQGEGDIQSGKDRFVAFLNEVRGGEMEKKDLPGLGDIYVMRGPLQGVSLHYQSRPVQLSAQSGLRLP